MFLNTASALAMTDQQVSGGIHKILSEQEKSEPNLCAKDEWKHKLQSNFLQPACGTASVQYQQITEADICKAEKNSPQQITINLDSLLSQQPK